MESQWLVPMELSQGGREVHHVVLWGPHRLSVTWTGQLV